MINSKLKTNSNSPSKGYKSTTDIINNKHISKNTYNETTANKQSKQTKTATAQEIAELAEKHYNKVFSILLLGDEVRIQKERYTEKSGLKGRG